MRWTPRALLPVAIALFVVLSAGVALALPATSPDNTGMVDNPKPARAATPLSVRSHHAGRQRGLGGRHLQRDRRREREQDPGRDALAAFDGTSGALASGVHIPIVTDASGRRGLRHVPRAGRQPLFRRQLRPRRRCGTQRCRGHQRDDRRTGPGFHPSVGAANTVLATASAIYVGTSQLKSFQLNGSATPGWSSPTVIIDASIRAHETLPQFRDIAIQGSTLVAACQCDSLTDATGTRNVKAVVEINAANGHWVNWAPAGLDITGTGSQVSGAFGITVLVHGFPERTHRPCTWLPAGPTSRPPGTSLRGTNGSRRTRPARRRPSRGTRATSWWAVTSTGCRRPDLARPVRTTTTRGARAIAGTRRSSRRSAPRTAIRCWTPSTATRPGTRASAAKYNGVWVVYTGPDGSTLNVGGEFTKVGGTWSGSGTNWTLNNGIKQQYFARLGGPAATTQTLTLRRARSPGPPARSPVTRPASPATPRAAAPRQTSPRAPTSRSRPPRPAGTRSSAGVARTRASTAPGPATARSA